MRCRTVCAERRRGSVGGVAVQPVLQHVEVEGRQVGRGVLHELVVDEVELVAVVGVEHARDHLPVPVQRVAVELVELAPRAARPSPGRSRTGSRAGSGSVADLAVGLGDALDHVVRDAHVLAVVDHDGPHPQDLGAVGVDQLLRVDVVAEALRDLLALGVDGEAVGDDGVVGRAAARRDADQQRRVEPAAVLVAALEVDVGRPRQVRALAEHGRVRRAGVEPDVEDVRLLVELAGRRTSGRRSPRGSRSFASRAYQASAVSFSKTAATWRASSARSSTSPQPLQ